MACGLNVGALLLKYLLGKQNSLIIRSLGALVTYNNSSCDVESLEQSMVGGNETLFQIILDSLKYCQANFGVDLMLPLVV